MPTRISDILRREVERSRKSRYELARDADLQESSLSRFMHGGGISISSADRLARALGLELNPIASRPRRKERK